MRITRILLLAIGVLFIAVFSLQAADLADKINFNGFGGWSYGQTDENNYLNGNSVPPPEFSSDAEMINFVKNNRSAIGYISPNASIDGVKVVNIE